MGITDFVPLEYLSKFFGIHLTIVIPIVFITGYFSLKLMKKYSLIGNLTGADDVFIIPACGFIWFLRISLSYAFSNYIIKFLNDPSISINMKENAQGYFAIFIILMVFSIVCDLSFLVNSFPLRVYSEKKRKYRFTTKLAIFWNKYSLIIVTIMFFLFSLTLTYGVLIDDKINVEISIPFFIFMSISLTPSISGLLKLIKKLT